MSVKHEISGPEKPPWFVREWPTAIPTGAIAVVYADAKDPDFFTDDFVNLLIFAAGGIAAFVKDGYTK